MYRNSGLRKDSTLIVQSRMNQIFLQFKLLHDLTEQYLTAKITVKDCDLNTEFIFQLNRKIFSIQSMHKTTNTLEIEVKTNAAELKMLKGKQKIPREKKLLIKEIAILDDEYATDEEQLERDTRCCTQSSRRNKKEKQITLLEKIIICR